MFNIIFFVILVWVLFKQNSRISSLEKQIKNNVVSPQVKNEIAGAPAVSPSPSTNVVQNIPTQASPKIVIHDEDNSGRLLGNIGIAAVLLGVAFFLKYAFDNNWIGPSGRVMIGIMFGVAFLVTGQILRKKYLQYSDLLMGGGISILYLSVFSAQAFYHLIDPFTTGIFMMAVTALAFTLSILNATMTLAVVGVAGGFATPFLSGSQGNNMLMLFGYTTLLNICVLGISFFKKWPKLIGIAFVGTGLNFIAWGSMYYKEILLPETMFFLFVSFIIFLIASIARAVTAGIKSTQDDYFLLGADAFGFAFVSYLLLLPKHESFLPFGAVLISMIYMFFAYLVNKFNPTDRVLNVFLPGLAVVFLSVAVPLQLSGPWIAVAWLIESCVLYYIASMMSNRGFQIMGASVYVLGLVNFFFWQPSGFWGKAVNFVPVFNLQFFILCLAVIVSYLIAHMYVRYGSITVDIREKGIMVFVIMANLLTIFALTTQVTRYYDNKIQVLERQNEVINRQIDIYDNGYLEQNSNFRATYYSQVESIVNQSNTSVSILWALYAALLTAIGFAKRFMEIRRLGLVLFIITGVKVVIDVWSLGQVYRIISFIMFGIIALVASFAYAKYKDRLKAIIVLFLIILSGMSFNSARADFNLQDWEYMRQISVPSSSDFAKIVLPEDISKWSEDFRDIRILNQGGIEVPYIITESIATKNGYILADILNKSVLNNTTEFIVDTKVDASVHTRLSLQTNSNNFKRQVSVYASNTLLPLSSSGWALLTNKGYIFKYTDSTTGYTGGSENIDFSKNTSRYFKVVIGAGEEGPVAVSQVIVAGDISVSTPVYKKTVSASVTNNQTKRSTEVLIDLGGNGYRTHSATLESTDRNYNRRVLVESSNDNQSWSYVGEKYISNISTSLFTGSSNTVSYTEQRSRYLRLSILNDDNMPIALSGRVEVEGPVYSAIFETRGGNTYTLYYGNPNSRAPVYDIARISSYIEENSIPSATYGAESLNMSYKAPPAPVIPFTEKNPWALNALLILIVVVIAFGIGMYLISLNKTHTTGGGFKGFDNKE